jgi:N-acetylglutamate synthase-like GNAT family acetyltransferase
MTASSVSSDALARAVRTLQSDYQTHLSDYVRLTAAVEKAEVFWASPVGPKRATLGGPAGSGLASVVGYPRLMRRVAGYPAAVPAGYDRGEPALVELRGSAELDLACRLLAQALDAPSGEVVPRRTTTAYPEPLHLRTWALLDQAEALCCAMTVCVGNVLVVRALATRPAQQRRGHASVLLCALHDLHERTGVVTDFALAAPDGQHGLFERLGYRPVESTTGSGRSDARPGQQQPRRIADHRASHRSARLGIGS